MFKPTVASDPLVADIEALLSRHNNFRPSGKFRAGPDERWFCNCGEKIDDDPSGIGILFRHRRHAAEKMAALLTRASA